MSNELLKSVMNNIARKNLKETDYRRSNFNYKSNNNYKIRILYIVYVT